MYRRLPVEEDRYYAVEIVKVKDKGKPIFKGKEKRFKCKVIRLEPVLDLSYDVKIVGEGLDVYVSANQGSNEYKYLRGAELTPELLIQSGFKFSTMSKFNEIADLIWDVGKDAETIFKKAIKKSVKN
jgi:hypothetical protein